MWTDVELKWKHVLESGNERASTGIHNIALLKKKNCLISLFFLSIARWLRQLPAQMQLFSAAPPGCHRVCSSLVLGLATWLFWGHHGGGSLEGVYRSSRQCCRGICPTDQFWTWGTCVPAISGCPVRSEQDLVSSVQMVVAVLVGLIPDTRSYM